MARALSLSLPDAAPSRSGAARARQPRGFTQVAVPPRSGHIPEPTTGRLRQWNRKPTFLRPTNKLNN